MKNQIGITRRDFVTGTLALVAGLGLSACASGGSTQTGDGSGSPQSAADDSGSSRGAEGHGGSHKVLVAYFSAQGHTKRVAERIAKDMDGDTFEVVPEQAYSDDDLDYNDDNSRVSKEYQDTSLRDIPLSATAPDSWADYDVVFVGYPIWWYDYAWPIRHFASDNDFASKTVIPFCTSVSSGIGGSGKNLAAVAGSGDWQAGQRFGEDASNGDIDSWVKELDL
ncbi:flavodoxin [Olsenella sp. Marseille-P4559]|uniref:flavodoxin n=1 Tax=Olsenella sp. Marseille-P4559 TaxID=2364795 RepID=UPI00102F9728|nr:flavodoxin [Olsenella sp. Marseille-P4559]